LISVVPLLNKMLYLHSMIIQDQSKSTRAFSFSSRLKDQNWPRKSSGILLEAIATINSKKQMKRIGACFYCLFVFVLPLEIYLSRENGLDPFSWFNPPHLYALPKPGPGFPSAKAINLFGINIYMIWVERWIFVLLILMELLIITV